MIHAIIVMKHKTIGIQMVDLVSGSLCGHLIAVLHCKHITQRGLINAIAMDVFNL